MASFKNKFSETAHHVYHSLKQYRKFSCHYKFIDRSKKSENLCIVLAGYKPHLFETVFARLHRYQLSDMDVCIITSGLFSDEIESICKRYDWSYLSTKENNVSLVQNVAIRLFANAQYIFKLDEDIFITKDYFKKMYLALEDAKKGLYNPGVIAPILPINGYGYSRVLSKLGLEQEYIKRFGKIKCSTTTKDAIQSDPSVAKFFWGEDHIIPSIDYMNEKFSHEPIKEYACPIRFSIGAILFERSLWEDMNGFRVVKGTNSLGVDEADMCNFCCFSSRPLMVSENIVVGHLSFGPQNSEMKKYFQNNKKMFIPGNENV